MRQPRPLPSLLLAAVLAPALLAGPAIAPPIAKGVGPLPDCRLDDILTEPRGYDDWQVILVDWILTLGSKYKPDDLVSVQDAGVRGGGLVRRVALDDLEAMAGAATKNGTPLVSWSAFRSYRQQVDLFDIYDGKNGSNFDNAITFSARPGHSEH